MSSYTLTTLGFLFGIVVGSYLAVIVDRYHQGRSANTGRSTCNHCQQKLGPLDLMPVLSYLALRGRCRRCHQPIGWQTLVIEGLAGLGAAAIIWIYGVSFESFGLTLAWWVSLVIIWIDLRDYLIPDGALVWLTGAALLVRGVYPETLSSGLLGLWVGVAILGGLFLLTRGKGMGLGDVKLMVPLGFLLGWPTILTGLFLAFILGSIVGLGLMLTHRRGWREAVPFGPFLLVGATLAMIWGEQLLAWYLGFARF